MNINSPRLLDSIAWDLLYADSPRGTNRALIDALADGVPPLTSEEVEANQAAVNYNDLSLTKALHSARTQFANGFLKTGNYFRCTTDAGSRHKRKEYGTIVTEAINKYLKRSVPYFEAYRSRIGSLCLHGIAPNVWENEDKWCPRSLGVGDVLIPSGTLLGFENLPFFFLRRSFTGIELMKITQAQKRDPGWNMDFVNRCLKWIEEQSTTLRGNYWPDIYSPERTEQRAKENNGGVWANDRAPVVNTFDVYLWNEEGDEQGWVRRIIIDTWSSPNVTGGNVSIERRDDMKDLHSPNDKTTKPAWDEFLFTSGDRKVAQSWQQIMSFQFADLSAVAPFRYHSVRSLGFLLYGVCTLQNRLNIKFAESVFETLMMLFRVKSLDDVQRALKLNLYNRGFLDDTVNPIPAQERWQPNVPLVQLMQEQLRQMIDSGTGTFAPRRDFSPDNVEKTRFQVMAEVNADSALVGAALTQAYKYQGYEDAEVLRRFLKANSTDPNVRAARMAILRQGVPEKVLEPEAWEAEHEQVMGGGSKTMEMQATQTLMQFYQLFDPSAQRIILRNATLAATDDAAMANQLVPQQPEISNSVHDSELAFGALMGGNMVTPKPGLNASEVGETIIRLAAQKIQMITQQDGGVGKPEDVLGLSMATQYAGAFVQMLSMDPESKQKSRELSDALGQVNNLIKGMAQRQQQMAEQSAQQNGAGGPDPAAVAKAEEIKMQGEIKRQNTRESHAERTAQKQLGFEQKIRQDAQKQALDLKIKQANARLKISEDKAKATIDILKERAKPVKGSSE